MFSVSSFLLTVVNALLILAIMLLVTPKWIMQTFGTKVTSENSYFVLHANPDHYLEREIYCQK